MNVELAAKAVKDLLIKKAIGDTLPMDMNDLSEYELEEAIRKSQEVEEKSDEVTRQIQIMRIENFVRNNGGSIELDDYNFQFSFEAISVPTIGVGYITNKNDDDFDFDEMDDDKIDELHGIIEQIELMDDKTMRRTEN